MTPGLEEYIKQLDLKPNSVLFVNVEKIAPAELIPLRLPYIGRTVPVIFTLGPPEVTMLSRDELERALRALDNDQRS